MTSFRSEDLATVGDTISRLQRQRGVTFVHGGHVDKQYGGSDITEHLQLDRSRIERRDSTPISDYPSLWQGLDIAICPLNPIVFNTVGKSPIKAMEASAAGVPFVAAACEPYLSYCEGLWAGSPAEYLAQLQRLIGDRQLRVDLADAAYQRVQQDDIARRWHDWHDCYLSLGLGQAKRMQNAGLLPPGPTSQPTTTTTDRRLVLAR